MMQRFWMVWNPAGNSPRVRHFHPDAAKDEATRLARLNPGQEFFVLRAEAKCAVNDVMWDFAPDDVPF